MMDMRLMGMCGAYCGACEWKEKTHCPGCQAAGSQMFWGRCEVARCAIERGVVHCGLCRDVPCARLQEAFDNPEHGDNGERLENLRTWAEGGRGYKVLTRKK